uniref:Uncharacterized protein n=1 Tax=Globisporangium ultimum (strain ATCC 200006 / CBS 805.95 / DAOM BR144) TaxID=431595 RepID=K3WK79_GLOUD
MINLPARDFSQDPMEIFNDYELPVKASDSSPRNTPSEQEHRIHGSQSARTASAFAQLLSPVVEAAAASAQQLLKKRKRLHSDPEGSREGDNVSAKKLMNLARIGTRFADRFLDSMIRDNAAVLQGEDKDYLQRSWNPLPVTRKPVANWRFAFENALKHHTGNGASQDAVCPPLRQTTLVRIRDRLKKLYSLPWTTEDNE